MDKKIIGNIIDELAKVESEVNMEIGVEIYDRSTGKDKIVLEDINKIIGKCIDDINKIYCGKAVSVKFSEDELWQTIKEQQIVIEDYHDKSGNYGKARIKELEKLYEGRINSCKRFRQTIKEQQIVITKKDKMIDELKAKLRRGLNRICKKNARIQELEESSDQTTRRNLIEEVWELKEEIKELKKYIQALEDKIISMATDYNIEIEDNLFDNILDNFKQKYNKKGV